jgi:transglutaminase-like putative cysteine protease
MISRSSVRHACLAAHVAAAQAALALSYGSAPAWGLLVLSAAAVFLRLPALPERVALALVWLSRALIAAVAIGGLNVAYPLGLVLGALAGVFLLGPTRFTAGAAVLPASLGILLAAGFNPIPSSFEAAVWVSAATLMAWLLLSEETALRPKHAASMLSVLVFAGTAGAIGRGLLLFLPWAQPYVEEAAGRYINPPPATGGMLLGPRLGDIEELALSHQVVLRLWSERAVALRSGVFTRFTGRFWDGTAMPRSITLVPGNVSAPADWLQRTPGEWRVVPRTDASSGSLSRIVLSSPMALSLPAPYGVDAVRLGSPEAQLDGLGLLSARTRPPSVYGLRQSALPPSDSADPGECLEIPASTDPRVRALAQDLGALDATAREKIARTVADLQHRCRYSLKVGKWTTGDPVSEFLFEKKKGYCEYFATAAVVLLRLQGVPARYVNGFSVRGTNRHGDHYVVRASDAHAWAEALVPGAGWVEVDATPPSEYEDLHRQEDSALEDGIEAVKAWWAAFVARVSDGGWAAALGGSWPRVLLGGAVLAVVVWIARRRRPSRMKAAVRVPAERAAPEILACFEGLEALWRAAGCGRPAHRGPREHVEALPDTHASLREVSAVVVQSFYRNAYGGETVPPEEIVRLRAALSAAVNALPSPPKGPTLRDRGAS